MTARGVRVRAFGKKVACTVIPPLGRLVAERDALRARLRVLPHTRPESVGRDYRYVFILAYGRSGSTLLQAILNSTPGVLIRGENRALPYYLHQFHQTALREAERVGKGARRRVNPFFGIYDYPEDVAVTRMRELLLDTVLRPAPRTKVVGFKEIRWYQDDLLDYLTFLQRVFPGARFILNTRDLDDVSRSSWWADRPDARQRLEQVEQTMLRATEKLGSAVYHVRYDEYVDDPTCLNSLFSWLGLEFDEDRIRTVMEKRYARIPGATARTSGEERP